MDLIRGVPFRFTKLSPLPSCPSPYTSSVLWLFSRMQLEQKVSYIYLTGPVITKIYIIFRQETVEKHRGLENKTEKILLFSMILSINYHVITEYNIYI